MYESYISFLNSSCKGKTISKIELIDDGKCWSITFTDKKSLLIDSGGAGGVPVLQVRNALDEPDISFLDLL